MATKPPHQVNLIVWVNDGRDVELVDSLNETLNEHAANGVIENEEGDGWKWLGTKGVTT